MNTISNTTNMTIRIDNELEKSVDQSLIFTSTIKPMPSQELLASLQEIEDYKNGEIELESYEDVKSLRRALLDD